jgi:hypothetical protein
VQSAGQVALGLAIMGFVYLASYPPSVRGTGAAEWLLPVEVAGFLKRHPPPGKMWNPLNLGGYLLYALAPEKKVFVDGRADQVYPRRLFRQSIRAGADPDAFWPQVLAHDVGFAVVEYRGEQVLSRSVLRHPNWTLVYWGDHTCVLVRGKPENRAYRQAMGYRQLRVPDATERLMNPGVDPHADQLAADVLENLKRAPSSIRAHMLVALMYLGRGDREAFARKKRTVEVMALSRDQEVDLP